VERIEYDEFGFFHENAAEYGLPYAGPPIVRRERVEVEPQRSLSALVWGEGDPEFVFLHGGAQNAHTWDTVALALRRPLIAIDLPGHGHSDGPGERPSGQLDVYGNAQDVAAVIRRLAPNARGVIGMSLGGVTTIALTSVAPELVRSVVLVDITPGVNAEKSKQISDFVNGPESFPSFDEILARTVEFNPTRTRTSLRRGILHNAEQREDGTWVWRHARFRAGASRSGGGENAYPQFGGLWDVLGKIEVPVALARGMLPQSVVDDDDEAELLRRLPGATVVHFPDAGHSIQGDSPVELAELIRSFVP
jgi:pimeloyl-ACP methyl ester carboxylesterase